MDHSLQIVIILTVGFTLASLFGFISQAVRLPAIFGYLLAGYLIGPFSPGFVADIQIAEQLSEIGVILMLFGVGLHFKIGDLLHAKQIAIVGAMGQTLITAIVGSCYLYYLGWPVESGIIVGLAIAVASTVVLVHTLSEKRLINTPSGHIAVGWLIVEDIFTVAILILLPVLAAYSNGSEFAISSALIAIFVMLLKFLLLAMFVFAWGHKCVDYILMPVARLRSRELLTLAVLALIFITATTTATVFGMSIALGAFIAGLMFGETPIRYQVAAALLSLKDAFTVIFFLSVGMLFNPLAILQNFSLFLGVLLIVLIIKPLVAFALVILLKKPTRTALIIAISLAQIGEFSFILAEEAMYYKLLPDAGYDILVACALVSISINSILLNYIDFFERQFQKLKVEHIFHSRMGKKEDEKLEQQGKEINETSSSAVLIGFGPIGRAVYEALDSMQYKLTVIDQNIDTVTQMRLRKLPIIFGDASQQSILETAHIQQANLLIITIPETQKTIPLIHAARLLNPSIRIIVRVTYISEQALLKELNAECICGEQEVLEQFIKIIQTLPVTTKAG